MSQFYRPDNWATARCRSCCDVCWACLKRPTNVQLGGLVGSSISGFDIEPFGKAYGRTFFQATANQAAGYRTYEPFDEPPSQYDQFFEVYNKGFGPMWPNYGEEFFEDNSGFGVYRTPVHPLPYQQNYPEYFTTLGQTGIPTNPIKSPFLGRADCAALFYAGGRLLDADKIIDDQRTDSPTSPFSYIIFGRIAVYAQVLLGYGLSTSTSLFGILGSGSVEPPIFTKSDADRAPNGPHSNKIIVRVFEVFTYSNSDVQLYGGLDVRSEYIWRVETHWAQLEKPCREVSGTINLDQNISPFITSPLLDDPTGIYGVGDYGGYLDSNNRYNISVTF